MGVSDENKGVFNKNLGVSIETLVGVSNDDDFFQDSNILKKKRFRLLLACILLDNSRII